MTRFRRTLACEVWLLAASPAGRIGLTLFVVAGILCALVPVMILGVPVTLGAQAASLGALIGSSLAVVVGPAAVVTSTGLDFDRGTRRTRYVAACPPMLLSGAQLGASVVACVMAVLVTIAAAAIAGLSDALVRRTLGDTPEQLAPGIWPGWTPIAATAVGLTVLTWFVVHAFASGKRGLAMIAFVALTWFTLLGVVRSDSMRGWLVIHPVAGIWSIANPSTNPKLHVDGPAWAFAVSAVLWSAILIAGAWRRLRRA